MAAPPTTKDVQREAEKRLGFFRRFFKRIKYKHAKFDDGQYRKRGKDVEKWRDNHDLVRGDYSDHRWKSANRRMAKSRKGESQGSAHGHGHSHGGGHHHHHGSDYDPSRPCVCLTLKKYQQELEARLAEEEDERNGSYIQAGKPANVEPPSSEEPFQRGHRRTQSERKIRMKPDIVSKDKHSSKPEALDDGVLDRRRHSWSRNKDKNGKDSLSELCKSLEYNEPRLIKPPTKPSVGLSGDSALVDLCRDLEKESRQAPRIHHAAESEVVTGRLMAPLPVTDLASSPKPNWHTFDDDRHTDNNSYGKDTSLADLCRRLEQETISSSTSASSGFFSASSKSSADTTSDSNKSPQLERFSNVSSSERVASYCISNQVQEEVSLTQLCKQLEAEPVGACLIQDEVAVMYPPRDKDEKLNQVCKSLDTDKEGNLPAEFPSRAPGARPKETDPRQQVSKLGKRANGVRKSLRNSFRSRRYKALDESFASIDSRDVLEQYGAVPYQHPPSKVQTAV